MIATIINSITKRTNINMAYIAKNSFWSLLTLGVASTSTLATSYVMANYLDAQVYGLYIFVFSVLSMLSITGLPGVSIASVSAIVKNREETYMRGVAVMKKSAIIGSILLIIIAGYFVLIGDQIELACILIYLAVFYPIYATRGHYNAYLNAKKQFKLQCKVNSLSVILRSAIVIVMILLQERIALIIVSVALYDALIGYVLYRYTKKQIKKLPIGNVDSAAISFGIKHTLLGIIAHVVNHIDKIIIAPYSGLSTLAAYSISIIVPNQVKVALKQVSMVLFPKFAEAKVSGRRVARYSCLLSVIMLSCYGAYYYVAPPVYELLFPKFPQAIKYTILFSVSFIFMPQVVNIKYLEARGEIKAIAKHKISSNVLRLVLLVVLINIYSVKGVILAHIIARGYGFFYSLILLRAVPAAK